MIKSIKDLNLLDVFDYADSTFVNTGLSQVDDTFCVCIRLDTDGRAAGKVLLHKNLPVYRQGIIKFIKCRSEVCVD